MKPWKALGLPPPKSEASGGKLSLKDYEVYSGLELPDCPYFVRLDGWKFHRLCKQLKLKQPFDIFLPRALVAVAKALMRYWPASYAYIFSDEINLFYPAPVAWRRIEKIDSVFAGLASSTFAQYAASHGKRAKDIAFDCRVIPLWPAERARELERAYLRWRTAECARNFRNAWAYWVLRQSGLSPRAVTKALEGLKSGQLVQLCAKHGVKLDRKPAWQRKGLFVRWKTYTKVGWDPIKKKKVKVKRKKLVVEWG